ncbi:serine/threonine-protein kinase bud32 [Thelotrema lepadinum]|nr:serine/threonine-protein kinase bud32 [Thelotrema lepadinum]
MLAEARILVKARREGVRVPGVLGLDFWGGGAEVGRQGMGGDKGEVKGEDRGKGEGDRGGKGGKEDGKVEGGEGRKWGGWMAMEWIEGGTVREGLERWVAGREQGVDGKVDALGGRQEKGEVEGEGNGEGGGSEGGKGKEGKSESESESDKTEHDVEWAEVVHLLQRIGRAVGHMHAAGIVHGDLTTSNLMLRSTPTPTSSSQSTLLSPTTNTEPPSPHPHKPQAPHPQQPQQTISLTGDLVLIDFGLSTQATADEDRAVDLYVLERAFGSTHPSLEEFFDREVLGERGYGGSFKGAGRVLKRLEDVRGRGRKRSMVG